MHFLPPGVACTTVRSAIGGRNCYRWWSVLVCTFLPLHSVHCWFCLSIGHATLCMIMNNHYSALVQEDNRGLIFHYDNEYENDNDILLSFSLRFCTQRDERLIASLSSSNTTITKMNPGRTQEMMMSAHTNVVLVLES